MQYLTILVNYIADYFSQVLLEYQRSLRLISILLRSCGSNPFPGDPGARRASLTY